MRSLSKQCIAIAGNDHKQVGQQLPCRYHACERQKATRVFLNQPVLCSGASRRHTKGYHSPRETHWATMETEQKLLSFHEEGWWNHFLMLFISAATAVKCSSCKPRFTGECYNSHCRMVLIWRCVCLKWPVAFGYSSRTVICRTSLTSDCTPVSLEVDWRRPWHDFSSPDQADAAENQDMT